MSNLIFILKDGPFGDCTSRYELGFPTPMTVEEFIKEVLSQNERGCIYIDDRCINYSKDRVLSGQWEDIKDCEVLLISAGGGWGLMDYRVTTKKKKKEYPKTYEECCEIMNVIMETEIVADAYSERLDDYELNLDTKIENLRKLLICRDAYWKIAGEEMGLGKPWELTIGVPIYYLFYNRTCGSITKSYADDVHGNIVFAFPTEEMRDAFYDNFKELIEQCKELL